MAEFEKSGNSAPSFHFECHCFQILPIRKEVGDLPSILLYIFLQCTWGIIQTSVGLLVFLKYMKCPHRFFGGAVHTGWKRDDGVSLGLFIFSPDHKKAGGQIEQPDRLMVHEYGHTIQSLMLGPLYLPVIGIPSAIWANCRKYVKLRETYGVLYSFCFAEGWADRLGRKMTADFINRQQGGKTDEEK